MAPHARPREPEAMVAPPASALSPLATLFMLVVVATGIALGLVRGRRGSMGNMDGWSAGDDGHCGADDGGSCDAH